jgi:hypothetical protein
MKFIPDCVKIYVREEGSTVPIDVKYFVCGVVGDKKVAIGMPEAGFIKFANDILTRFNEHATNVKVECPIKSYKQSPEPDRIIAMLAVNGSNPVEHVLSTERACASLSVAMNCLAKLGLACDVDEAAATKLW